MKRLKGFVIFFYIFLTVLVLIAHPVMHKPVALENTRFKIKEQLMNPQTRRISDFEVKLKFYRAHPDIAKASDSTIHIKPQDDEKQLWIEYETGAETQDRTIRMGPSGSFKQKDVDLKISGNETKSKDSELGFEEFDIKFSDKDIRITDDSKKTDVDLPTDISDENVRLKDSDEVGNRKFKGTREEIIAWNVWRSELQNRIMDESAIEAPVGTLILFSFDVSGSGKISNLQYTCTNRKFAAEAKTDMVNILKHLEGDSILDFPTNTKRSHVRFKGGFILDYDTVYSKPSDYSDYERVRL